MRGYACKREGGGEKEGSKQASMDDAMSQKIHVSRAKEARGRGVTQGDEDTSVLTGDPHNQGSCN